MAKIRRLALKTETFPKGEEFKKKYQKYRFIFLV